MNMEPIPQALFLRTMLNRTVSIEKAWLKLLPLSPIVSAICWLPYTPGAILHATDE